MLFFFYFEFFSFGPFKYVVPPLISPPKNKIKTNTYSFCIAIKFVFIFIRFTSMYQGNVLV